MQQNGEARLLRHLVNKGAYSFRAVGPVGSESVVEFHSRDSMTPAALAKKYGLTEEQVLAIINQMLQQAA